MNEPLAQWTAWLILFAMIPVFYVLFRFVRSQRRANIGSTVASWANPATSCLNAYIKREYAICAASGQAALVTDFLPTVGPVTILALRRLGLMSQAEELGRKLLLRSFGHNGSFLMYMRLIDGDLEPERCLQNRSNDADATSMVCELYFYWGAKLLTDRNFTDAFRPLLISTWTDCDALERELANADLKTVTEQLLATGEFTIDNIDEQAKRILAEHQLRR